MGIVTRLFTAADTVNIWELLNEMKGWIDDILTSGVAARYWTGYPAGKTLTDGRNTSINFGNQVEAIGGVTPTWDGDTFKLPAGRYRIDVQLTFDANNTGYRTLSVLRNPGVTTYNNSATPPGTFLRAVQVESSSNNTSVQATKIVSVSGTDVLMIVGRQNSGGNLPILTALQDSELIIQRIGD